MTEQEERILLFEDRRGVYIPRDFAEEMDHSKFTGYDQQDVEDLEDIGNRGWDMQDPDAWQIYWETWDRILNNAEHVDEQGYTWHLEQDMDVFLVCPELERQAKQRRREADLERAIDEVADAIDGHTRFHNDASREPQSGDWSFSSFDGTRFHITIELADQDEGD